MRAQQQEIIQEMGVVPVINPEEEINNRVAFLEQCLADTGMKGFVLGISGGQDSLLAGILAQNAVNNLREKGFEATFHAMLLPYGNQADRADALLACKVINPDVVHDFDIKPGTDALAASYEAATGEAITDYDKGNVKARMRMIAQYAIASANKLLVVGTDHAAEAVTGFFTKYGDGGADILPISGLNKRQGRALLQAIGVPEVFTTKAPTADLLDAKPGQTDESELGMVYDQIDDYLEGQDIGDNEAEKLEARHKLTAHKRTVPVACTR